MPLEACQKPETWVIIEDLNWDGCPCIWNIGNGAGGFISLSKNTKYGKKILK